MNGLKLYEVRSLELSVLNGIRSARNVNINIGQLLPANYVDVIHLPKYEDKPTDALTKDGNPKSDT